MVIFMKVTLFLLIFLGMFGAKSPIDVDAQCAILMEKESKRILYQKNIDEIHLTASIAKIMTAIVAIEKGELDSYCLVDQDTINQVGSSIYLQKGDKIKLIDLIYGLMLRSGNDAAYLIAKSVSSNVENFVKDMNNKAKELKMQSSVFNNPSGLDENTCNYSSARDMALLMAYAMDNKTFRKVTSSKNYRCKTFNDTVYVFTNKHRLVQSNENCIGGKTGYTKMAKRTLVSSFEKDGLELIVVTFNSGNDFNIHNNLSAYGFENYENVKVFNSGIIDVPQYKVTPIIYEDVIFPVRNDERMRCEIHLLNKPTNKIIGKIYLIIDAKIVRVINVYRYY
jgi:D-alanyl-D-alanine carboxypeptidase